MDPRELYELDARPPEAEAPVLLALFDGFLDAGKAGKLLGGHLIERMEHRVVATFDVDQLLDYRSRRPQMVFDEDHWADAKLPELVVREVTDAAGEPFLLLTGPEPDQQWNRFVAALTGLIERFGVRLTVTAHGIPMAVPHTRPVGMTAHATRKELIAEHTSFFNKVEVPGSVAALLEFRLGEQGRDALGFAVHVPHYLAQLGYPDATVAALRAVARSTGLSLPEEELVETAERTRQEIQQQVDASEDAASVVSALERQYDLYVEAQAKGGNLLAPDLGAIPTADELGAEFERFLAERDGGDGPA
nr:PAC2 family protein [Allonocardiopsis opalescens]